MNGPLRASALHLSAARRRRRIGFARRQDGAVAPRRRVRVRMKTGRSGVLEDGAWCKVVAGTHAGKYGSATDIHTSKTGRVTLTVVQKDGVRFKTLARNVAVQGSA